MFKETTKPLEITPDTMPIEVPRNIELKPWQSVLLKAAAMIEEKGWTRHDFKIGQRHCAVGAMRAVLGRPVNPDDDKRADGRALTTATNRLFKVAQKIETGFFSSIPEFNDYYAKSGKQIASIMREAAGVKNAGK